MAEMAFAFELSLGPAGLPRSLEAGIGLPWYGVDTQQSVTDSATIHALLWKVARGHFGSRRWGACE